MTMPNPFGIADCSNLNVAAGLVTIKEATNTNLVLFENEFYAIKKKSFISTLNTLTLQNGLRIDLTKDQKVLVKTTTGKMWLRSIELHQHHYVVVALGGSFSQDYYKVFENKTQHFFDENMARFVAQKHRTFRATNQALLLAFPNINLSRNPDELVDYVLTQFGYSQNNVPKALFLSPETVVRAYLQECFIDSFYTPKTSTEAMEIRSLLLKIKILGSGINTIFLTSYEHNMLNCIETDIVASDVAAYKIPHSWTSYRPLYINSKLNNYFVTYKLEVDLAKDFIDKDFAFCQVKSLFCDGYKKETFQLDVENFSPFSANGFVLSSNL